MTRASATSTSPDAVAEAAKAAVEAYLSLGSNLGDRRMALIRAVGRLAADPAMSLDENQDIASLYETAPVGCPDEQPPYLNTAVRVRTTLAPPRLLELMLEVEASLGRVRRRVNEARVIDIDLLLYGDRRIDCDGLVVPHPAMVDRRFVLEPLCDLVPGRRIPGTSSSVRDLMLTARTKHPEQTLRRVAGPEWALWRGSFGSSDRGHDL